VGVVDDHQPVAVRLAAQDGDGQAALLDLGAIGCRASHGPGHGVNGDVAGDDDLVLAKFELWIGRRHALEHSLRIAAPVTGLPGSKMRLAK